MRRLPVQAQRDPRAVEGECSADVQCASISSDTVQGAGLLLAVPDRLMPESGRRGARTIADYYRIYFQLSPVRERMATERPAFDEDRAGWLLSQPAGRRRRKLVAGPSSEEEVAWPLT